MSNSTFLTRLLAWTTVTSVSVVAVGSSAGEEAFLRPPSIVTTDPGPDHRIEARQRQGIPSAAQGRDGRLWVTWYAGPTEREDNTNYVVLATSGDDGTTWEEALVIDPDGPDGTVRAFDPQLWLDPTESLWLFWAQATGHDGSVAGVWAMTAKDSERARPDWTEPRRLTDGVLMGKPTVLSAGEWVLPASTWRRTDDSARMVVSTDEGKTWKVRGAANVPREMRNYDEHLIVERRDETLWMLVRLAADRDAPGAEGQWPAPIGESVSTGRGTTWSEVRRGSIPHVQSRFHIERLASGNLLLVKHADHARERRDLAAYLSEDDGDTWRGGLILESRSCSYPDGFQAEDGRIFVVYDRRRARGGHIMMAVFTEEDVIAGEIVSDSARLRIPVSSLPQVELSRNRNEDGVPLANGSSSELVLNDGEVGRVDEGTRLFTDRSYTWHEVPEVLEGRRYARTSMNGGEFRANRDGVVFVATPAPERNRDSVEATLLQWGFERVALPEFLLFEHSSGSNNLCSLYQKKISEGDTFELGKWGIMIW